MTMSGTLNSKNSAMADPTVTEASPVQPTATIKDSHVITELKNRVKLLDTVASNFSSNLQKRRRSYQPPVGLETPYNELYSLLHPCLVENNSKQNVAALVMGKRGTGKTLLVEDTLSTLQDEASRKFRIVRLNGLVIRGDDVGHAVKEIIRQLSDIAMMESPRNRDCTLSPSRQSKMKDLLRLRQSSFTSNLALLDEVLHMARVDGVPILIVLDEFDALLGSSASLEPLLKLEGGVADRQLLLYHLLDRVTTQGTSLCLVAITSHLAAVSMLEKRVKSRAEGTCKVIFLNPYPTYDRLVEILLCKINVECNGMAELKEAVSSIIFKPVEGIPPDDKQQRIQYILERNFQLGKDLRWFCRVLSCALALYREDLQSLIRRQSKTHDSIPTLTQDHFLQALVSMNASFANEGVVKIGNVAVDPRLQALLDLSGPQVALVLSARRILARDAHTEESSPKPLTLQRMLQEYQSYRGPNRYQEVLLKKCFTQLLETDVFRPSADHTGGGPLQYGYSQSYYEMEETTISRMPLHVPVDIQRELGEALQQDLLECSTSLREWGKRKN